MNREMKLEEGEKLNRNPDKPEIHIVGEGRLCYLWIGNNGDENNRFCYATKTGQKTLEKFAVELLKALKSKHLKINSL